MTKYDLFLHHLTQILDNKIINSKHFSKFFEFVDNNRFTLCNKKRQVGVTAMLLAYALANPFKKVLYLTTDQRSAEQQRKRIDYLPVVKGQRRNLDEIANIKFKGASINALIGYKYDILIMDEVAYMNHSDSLYCAMLPLLSTGGRLIMTTTPVPNLNELFNKLWYDSLDDKNNFKLEGFGGF